MTDSNYGYLEPEDESKLNDYVLSSGYCTHTYQMPSIKFER